MNITLNNVDPVNAIIKIEVIKDDYNSEVVKNIKNLRQQASIPGFRKGMAPASLVQKMYGKSVLIDEVNKVVSKNLYNYIQENKLNVLGEPLPNETEQKEIDFDNNEDFEFCFDLGLAPEMKVKLTKKDKLPYYNIKVDEELVNKQIENFKANYGSYSEAENIEGKDLVKGLLIELDENGTAKENGIHIEEAVLMPFYMKNEAEKAKFMGAAKNTVITFNPFEAYEGAQAELASFLKIKKEEVKNYTGNFTFEIREITRYAEAEMNQELFDKVFGEGVVKNEEEFRGKIYEMISQQYAPDCDYKFMLDARALLEKKAGNVEFPDAFLKRWLLASNQDRTEESVEEDYPKILEDLKFHLIKEQIVKDNDLKVDDKDIMEHAKQATRAQFAQYGMANVPDDLLENYAKEMLKKEETVRNLIDRAVEAKLITWLKEHVALEDKEVTVDEFKKFFE